MAYEIIKRLSTTGEHEILHKLRTSVSRSKFEKGQLHSVFKESFDAKAITSKKFLLQKLNYMYLNPVRGNYNLIEDWRDYPHSSASFYEFGNSLYFCPKHYDELE